MHDIYRSLLADIHNKTILVAALDWGLGHATRSIALIYRLQAQTNTIILAGSGDSGLLLKNAFPSLPYISLPGYDVKYSKNGFSLFHFSRQIPRLLKTIKEEQHLTEGIVNDWKPDIIISDNRYGIRHKGVQSILLTHQLTPALPSYLNILYPLLKRQMSALIKPFDEVWVPDAIYMNLTGLLSQNNKIKIPVQHIGILSRFNNTDEAVTDNTFPIIAILSGPEPARTYFQNQLIDTLKNLPTKALIIQGKPNVGENIVSISDTLYTVPHLSPSYLKHYLLNANTIIARSGYSTIMDLIALNKRAILVPTPGQTEQEYLAKHLNGKYGLTFIQQSDINKITF